MISRKVLTAGVTALFAVLLATAAVICAGSVWAADDGNSKVKTEEDVISFCKEASELKEIAVDEGGKKSSSSSSARLLIVSRGEVDFSGCEGLIEAVSNGDSLCVAQFDSAENAEKAAGQLKDDDSVESVEFDKRVKCTETENMSSVQELTFSHLSWGAQKIGADSYVEFIDSIPHGQVEVAIVDTGVQTSHPFLRSRMLTGYNFIDQNTDVTDESGHGTHVAGIIIDCTQWLDNIRIIPIKSLDKTGHGYYSDIAYGMMYGIQAGAEVVNASIGGEHSDFYEEAIAASGNASVVVSAGNENCSIDKNDVCPAHIKKAVTVAAIDSDGTRAEYSNYGKTLDLAAPGTDIYSTSPGNSYRYESGTSMAAPHASACIAMMKLYYGNISVEKTDNLITRATTRGKEKLYYGKGVLNMKLLFKKIKASNVKLSYTKCVYSGKKKTPSAKITINSGRLFKTKDYRIRYVNNKRVGVAKAVITGRGTYSGKVIKRFRIYPKRASAKLYVKKGHKLKVRIGKKASVYGAKYFEIRYKKKGSSKWRKKITSKRTVILKSLKKGKKYYVKVRAYKKVNGTRYYGKWSVRKTSKKIK